MIKAENNTIACSPFPTNSIELQKRNGVTLMKEKTELTGLTVIFGNAHFEEGWTVYVKGDGKGHQWSKEVYEIDGKKFILIPCSMILLSNRTHTASKENSKCQHYGCQNPKQTGSIFCTECKL